MVRDLTKAQKRMRIQISFLLGFIGLFLNYFAFSFQYKGLTLLFPLGGFLGFTLAIAWGWKDSLPAAIISSLFLFCQWRIQGWGLLYLYPLYTLWIPLLGFLSSREKEKWEVNRNVIYYFLFAYTLLNGLGYLTLYNWLLSFNPTTSTYWGALELKQLIILCYKDQLILFSCLNMGQLLLLMPDVRKFLHIQSPQDVKRKTGFRFITSVVFSILGVWFLIFLVNLILTENITFSQIFQSSFSGDFIMKNMIYFNIIVISATIYYQNWAIQANTTIRLAGRSNILKIILDTITEGALVLDKQLVIRYANSSARDLVKSETGLFGTCPDDLKVLYSIKNGKLLTQNDLRRMDLVSNPLTCMLKGDDGELRRIIIRGAFLPESKYSFHFLCMFRDITREYEQEQKNIHAQKQEAVGRLVGGVAHDFNNRLSGIMGYAQLLEEETDLDTVHSYARQITKSSQSAADLTKQLLTFSRKRPINYSEHDLVKLLDNIIPILRRTLDRGVRIIRDDYSKPLPIRGDESLLENSIINLAINASYAMEKSGSLIFSTDIKEVDNSYTLRSRVSLPPGTYASLSVIDTGQGIDPVVLDKIFDPFFTTKKNGEGTGLGLSTVQEIVTKHHGEITVMSEVGEGTIFVILLPLLTREEPQHP